MGIYSVKYTIWKIQKNLDKNKNKIKQTNYVSTNNFWWYLFPVVALYIFCFNIQRGSFCTCYPIMTFFLGNNSL